MTQDNSGGCVYSFQVWRPNQDMVNKMHDLTTKCENTSRFFEHELLSIKNDVLRELLNGKNLSHRVEKEMLQQKLEGVQTKMALSDMRLKIEELKSHTKKLSDAQHKLQHIEKQMRSSGEFSKAKKKIIREELSGINHVVGHLKNSVGNLKAEWLLLKREVKDVQTENAQLKGVQNDLQTKTSHMKETVDILQADTQLLKDQKSQFNLNGESFHHTSHGESISKGKGNIDKQISNLKLINDRLSNEFRHLKRQNSKLKRQVVAIQVVLKNANQSEVSNVLMDNSISQLFHTDRDDISSDRKSHPKGKHVDFVSKKSA